MYSLGMGQAGHRVPAFVGLAGHPVRWQLLAELGHTDLRVRELVARVGLPQNLISYHLRLLRDGGLVTARRSSFDGRDSYYHLDLDRCAEALAGAGAALHPALSLDSARPARYRPRSRRLSMLFVCTGNSARSPIAEALLRRRAGGHVRVVSAGIRPRPDLHPHTVRVLSHRFGIDVTAQRPRTMESLAGRRFDYVITLCDKARESLPGLDGHPRRLHWSVPDPAAAGDSGEAAYQSFIRTAADIDTRVRHLLPVLSATDLKEVVP
jgi:ArsR family transcriptional regulator, arsenate/arsenite/antimonite-responsive transcriptional repressor / arsenate reductase (thioredoxin)